MTSFTRLCTSILAVVFLRGPLASCSSQFLRPREALFIEGMSPNEARQLNAEIESLFGRSETQASVTKFEDALRPIFMTLSSNGKHGLGHAATRYSLHRYFEQRHGWQVHGIAANGSSWNGSSATAFLEGKVPDYVRNIFEERLDGDGLDLHGVAVLAATVEHIVRIETASRLERSFEALGLSTDETLSFDDVDSLMDIHMLLTFFGDRVPTKKMQQLRRLAHKVYPGWEDTQNFVRDLRLNVAYATRESTNPFVSSLLDFSSMLHLVEVINDQHGQFQDKECQALKQILLTVENKGTGRVRLPDFYGLAKSGHPQFVERQEYLRDLGVLDESDSNSPSVMIANWLYSDANCLGSSVHYNICCVNECNVLMAHLEKQFLQPGVSADRLLAAVARLPSSTVAAPRNLSKVMTRRLHDIAESHHGVVPLHGRLFAQWMHHAYPRECQYPNVAGTTRPLGSVAWKAANGGKGAILSADELEDIVREPVATAFPEDEDAAFDELPWMMDEEAEQNGRWEEEEDMFIVPGDEGKTVHVSVLRWMAVFAAVISVIAMLVQSVLSVQAAKIPYGGKEKYVV